MRTPSLAAALTALAAAAGTCGIPSASPSASPSAFGAAAAAWPGPFSVQITPGGPDRSPEVRPAPDGAPREAPEVDPGADIGPAPEAEGESSGAPEAEAGREARLDALFEQLAQAEKGPHERIERDIRRLLSRSGSDSMDLLLMRARDALEAEDLVRALHHLSAAVQHRPGFAEAWNLRATAFFMRGNLGQALADLERVLALEPRHFGALSGLGVILEQLGRERDALQAYRAAQRVNPHLEQVARAIERLAPKVDGRDI